LIVFLRPQTITWQSYTTGTLISSWTIFS
jgi:hypothetical protein